MRKLTGLFLLLFIALFVNAQYAQDSAWIKEHYYKMEKYKAAHTAFQNLLRDYPDSQHAEYVMFLIVKSDYYYALNSVPNKQEERYESAINSYKTFTNKYTSSQYQNEAQNIYEASVKNINKLKTNDKN